MRNGGIRGTTWRALPDEGDEAKNSGGGTPVLGNRVPRGQNPAYKDQGRSVPGLRQELLGQARGGAD